MSGFMSGFEQGGGFGIFGDCARGEESVDYYGYEAVTGDGACSAETIHSDV